MAASGAGMDEGVTISVTVNRSELDALADTLGTHTDAETVEASVHDLYAAAVLAHEKLAGGGLGAILGRRSGATWPLLIEGTTAVVEVKRWQGQPSERRIRELRARMRELAKRLPDARLIAIVNSVSGVEFLTLQNGEFAAVEGPVQPLMPGKGVSAEQFAALFEGDEPIDPDRYRSDLDELADPSIDDPYDRAHGVEE